MINLKSKLVNATLAASFAIPLVSAGIFTSAGSAQAYTGGFTFDGSGTTANITKTGITFNPAPGSIALGNKDGDFLNDTNGTIYSFLNASLPSKFIDVGAKDGVKLLSLTNLFTPSFKTILGGTDISFDFYGLFEDGSKAVGNIDFTALRINAKQAETAYNQGEIKKASFKGVTVSSVPEPAALLGLGAVGAVMAMSRRRKSFAQ